MLKKTAVVGAGASGMMAAVTAASNGNPVTIFEHTLQPGKKLLLTGNGKCNFTNRDMSEAHFHSCSDDGHIGKVLKSFSADDTIEFFSHAGLFTKEKNGCVYPYTDMSATVLSVLRSEMDRLRIKVVCDHHIDEISDPFIIDGETFDCVILAAGGKTFPKTGSDGSGFDILKKLGCRIVKVLPALTSVSLSEDLSMLKGVRCRAALSLFINGEKVQDSSGELQPYDGGLSGICAMDLSGLAIRALDEGADVYILCDFMPDMDEEELKAYIKRMKEDFPERNVNGWFEGIFAPKLLKYLLHPLDSRKEDFVSSVVDTIKRHRFCPDTKMCADLSRAQTVSGGLSFSQVTPDLMLKDHPGIYVCGELLDVYGDCGGYNLQWAFSSGHTAGRLR
ncbi:MAG: aminoacetone oxidase family FAD-binding enzyme [Lachnospiraceae bacterium]|nr:aminoacetone oxidase family FAD-binding enzyme [Lachnospiraceae bacterium]